VVGDLVGEGSAQEQAVVGETPNLAARLQAMAEPGQIVLAGLTRRLIGDLFRLRELGRLGEHLIDVPVGLFHAVEDAGYVVLRHGLMEEVAHRVDEDQPRLSPAERLQ
jgi:class 3 adenylate cyclase